MSSGEVRDDSKLIELKDESDFEKVLSPDGGLGLLSVCGFGSLLSGKDDRYHHY